jgi:hypothetical protein
LHYGFTVAPADNPFNCARVKSELELDSQKTALTSGMKQMLVSAMVGPSTRFFVQKSLFNQ